MLILAVVLTQIYLPGAKILVKANTQDVENAQEERDTSAETIKEEQEEEKTIIYTEDSESGTDSDNSDGTKDENGSDYSDGTKDENGSDNSGDTGSENGSNNSDGTEDGSDSTDNEEKEEDKTDSGEDSEEGTDPGKDSEEGSEDKPEEPAYFEQYRVTFQVTGEDDQIIENAAVTVQKSVDDEDFRTQEALSDKVYDLDVKQDENFLIYKFHITADGYLPGDGTFCFDPGCEKENPYFDLDTIEQAFTITVHMNVNPDQYRVEIKAVDENGNPIENPVVNMNWSVDVYGSYPQEAVSPGVYILQKKRGNDWLYYTFRVSKDGYTPYDGSKFCFHTSWWNPYFDVKADKHFLTITVTMTSVETELENAKTKAVQELQNYKKLEDYRQAEQEKITDLIATWTTKIQNSTTVSSVNWNLDQAQMKLDALKTNIQYEDEEYRSRIYFQTDDGQKIYVDPYGVATITNIDSGNFYITRPDGSLYANNEWDARWRCVYEYNDLDHPESIAFQVVVGTYGQFAGKFVGKYDATVTLSDLGRAVHFTVRVINGRVDKLRASVDGKDMSGKTLKVMGSEKKTAAIEGRLKGTDRWVSIPVHALKYTAGGSTSVRPATGEFRTWGTSGSITYTLDADRSVSVTVNIQATIIRPTGVRVICPSRATVGDWNGAFGQYVGIMEGEGGYRVEVTPSNASNPGVTWEDLTPDVATFQSLHALGIVPKKAGTAQFRVTCVDNPEISTTVTILFQYEKPLKTAEAEKSVYYAKTSDKTIDLKIITNGIADSASGASEQRFYWSYSTSGVAKVSDAVHYDKSSVTIPSWFSHTISILGTGAVYVTGTPYDTTENCKPVTFKVVVTDTENENLDRAEAERVEQLILAIGQVTLEKKSQIQNARSEFKALTSTQKGLVDDDIYDILVKAELELRRLERAQAGGGDGDGGEDGDGDEEGGGETPPEDGKEDGSEEGGGGTPPEQSGDSAPNVENAGDSEEHGQEESGGAQGTNTTQNETVGGDTESPEKTDSIENAEETVQKETYATVAVTDKVVRRTDAKARKTSKKAGKKSSGRKFLEVDINDVQEEIQQIVDEISPATKAAVSSGALLAFAFGFLWRRREYLQDIKNNRYMMDLYLKKQKKQ